MKHIVLFVDDEPLAIESVVRSMRRSGLELLTATSAAQGLALLAQHVVDVVVSDQQMPGMQGHEFLEVVAKRWPSTVRIMLTGQAEFEVAQHAINRGSIHQFLVKPCDSATLFAALNSALQRIELERASRGLLRVARKQRGALDLLEEQHPGITAVARDSDGAVVLAGPEPADVAELIHSMKVAAGDGHPAETPTPLLPAASPVSPQVAVAAEEWRTIVDALDDLVCFVDADGRVIRANRTVERWGLCDVKTVAGRPLHDVLHGSCNRMPCPTNGWILRAMDPAAPGDGQSGEVDDARMARTLRLSCTRLPPSAASPQRERHLVIIRDTTHERVLEDEKRSLESQLQQSQKLEAIGRLAAGVAHEINTPTQFVRDNLEFLRTSIAAISRQVQLHRELADAVHESVANHALVDAQRTALRELDIDYLLEEMPKASEQGIEGIARIASIVRALKAFSHPGGGERTHVDLKECIESTVTVARNEWKYVAEVGIDVAPEVPLIEGYPGELNQVFLNLIVNAAQAIGEQPDAAANRSGRIRVTVRRDGEQVELRFADNGPGIPLKAQPHVFEPFFTTKPIGKGTGQGLALARSVVVGKHGGTIRFDSVPGHGTTFILRLPITASASQPNEPHPIAAVTLSR